ncbi:hypothetical protein WIX39_026155 [Variovorax sp. AB1(2024)]|uniref:hypothetical protein n=1 Tax=Variovorax sp. AB1(2024) TaxID=3132214 RepID=UPI0030AD4013
MDQMKHLLDIPQYDERAFAPVAGRMRLYGGKSAAPAAPDYIGQANAQAAGNLAAARATTAANRINQVTPYGSIKYTQGTGFDQAGYDKAVKDYEWTQNALDNMDDKAQAQQLREYYAHTGAYQKPTREQFTSDPDTWSSQIELSDTGKQLLDAFNKTSLGLADLQGTAMDRVRSSLATPFDTSGLIDINDKTGMDGWDRATDLIRQRQNPELDRQQAALDAKLANQGLTQGSEGWSIGQSQFGKQRADADIAAQLAGLQAQNQFFNQAISGNQATLQQRNFLRQLPLNELNALRTGSQVTNPTFNTPGQQGQTSGPDLLGATKSQYESQVGNVNAQNAQSAQATQAGIGVLATIASFY